MIHVLCLCVCQMSEEVDLDENLLDFSALFETEARHKALMSMK